MRLSVFALLFALVAAFYTGIPTPAEAASALFRLKRTWWGGGATTANGGTASPHISTDFHPRMKGPSKAPPASGLVHVVSGSVASFSIPSKVIKDYTRSFACPTFMDCRPFYPVSVSYHSYWNVKGDFRQNNPYGAMTTTTVRFSTTGNGEPTSPTTDFSGRYDFSRSGSIMITPGKNRFGGTQKFFHGPNHHYYQAKTSYTGYLSRLSLTAADDCGKHCQSPSLIGSVRIARPQKRYRYTSYGYYPVTTGTPSSPGDHYAQRVQYISTVAPWTTGVIALYSKSKAHPTHTVTRSGYDNRTPGRFNGVISLVRPRLVHSYVVPHDPNLPIVKGRSFARIWQIDIHFLPEPAGMLLLVAGVAALLGLSRMRRR